MVCDPRWSMRVAATWRKARIDANEMVTDFVCIPRPIERNVSADGGPLRYRMRHAVPMWRVGEHPQMHQFVVEGDVWC